MKECQDSEPVDIVAWNENTPNEMGRFIAEQIKRAKQVDILTGYFFFDGFESIQKELGENPNVTLRILVGMDAGVDTSGLIHEVYKHEKSHAGDDDAIRKEYLEQLRQVLRKWPTEQLTKYQSDAWKQYAGMIEKGHLQIRKTRRPNHSKVYIFHSDPANPGEQISYIGGSSNFSYSGLCDRNEFNIHVNQERAKDVVRLFNELWDNAVPIAEFKKPSETPEHGKPPIVDILNKETPDSPVNPFDAYMKVLYEYMALQKTDDKLDSRIRKIMRDAQFPDGGKIQEQQYQIDAIQRAQNILNTHGGVIIADVVGLGKSIVASVLASLSDAPGIIIAPAALCGEGNWATYIQTFRLKQDGWCCYSYGKINYIPQDVLLKARTIILDEAHNIRNPNTEAYQDLKKICFGKKIIFLSATPFNNKPEDIHSLISLISSSHVAGYSKNDLETMFKDFSRQYQEIKKTTDILSRKKAAAELSEAIRKIVSPITVRRNRLDLIHKDSPYKKEMENKISELESPRNEEFELSKDVSKFYEKILSEYFAGDQKEFKGFMYTPELSNGHTSDTEGQLFSMICHFIVTRWESSPVAFRETVRNVKNSLDASIKLFESEFGTFFRFSPGKTADAWDGNDTDLSKLPFDFEKEWKKAILKGKSSVYVRSQQYREKLLQEIPGLKKELISILDKPDAFLAGLKRDSAVLQTILEDFGRMKLDDPKKDAKFQCLVSNIRKVLNGEYDAESQDAGKLRKIIVFSGFADTAKYVADNLSQLFPDSVMYVSGESIGLKLKEEDALNFGFSHEEFDRRSQAKQPLTMRDAILRNFKFSALPKDPELRGRWKILVCTDVLSEGIDLNAAGIVFNYDMAYNPVRIIQRLGRINRISDKVFETLYRVNFFPTPTGEDVNNVKKISTLKAHFIQELFAEDFSILTEEEKVERAELIFGSDPANGPMSEDLQIRGMFTQALELKCGTDEVRQKKYLDTIKKLPGRFCKFYGKEETLFFFFRDAVSISAMSIPQFIRHKTAPLRSVSLVEAIQAIQTVPDQKEAEFHSCTGDPLWDAYSYWNVRKFAQPVFAKKGTKTSQNKNKAKNLAVKLGVDGKIVTFIVNNPDFAQEILQLEVPSKDDIVNRYANYHDTASSDHRVFFLASGIVNEK